MVIMTAECALQAGLDSAAPVPAAPAGKPVGSQFTFGSHPAVPVTSGAHRPSETAAAQDPAGSSAVEGAASGSHTAANPGKVSTFYKCPICHHLMLTCGFRMVFNAFDSSTPLFPPPTPLSLLGCSLGFYVFYFLPPPPPPTPLLLVFNPFMSQDAIGLSRASHNPCLLA